MRINQVKLIYFSPTGTTRTVLENIAIGTAVNDVEHIDLTLPKSARQTIPPFSDELVIVGAPVYGGRLPVDAIERLKQTKANKTPVVPIVLYGNREFEDALLELTHLTLELGFRPVAAGAFIGEHSYASEDIPIANGRPDSRDMEKAKKFGAQIRDKIAALLPTETLTTFEVPGSFPYEAGGARPMPVSPVTREEICTVCGTCAEVCPTAAISINGAVATETELCIRCCACIKNCPESARVINAGPWLDIAHWLNENCSIRKEPQTFGV
jgi:ferredoxin